MTNSDIELKIIEATIDCIEKHGVKAATIRRIAQEADVNVAAINYYFRTKEQLMDRVMEVTLLNGFDWDHFKDSENDPPKERLKAILYHMTEGAQRYPQISRMHLFSPMLDLNVSSSAQHTLTAFMNRLYDDMIKRGVQPGPRLKYALIQAISASMMGIGIMLDLYTDFADQDFKNTDIRNQYIDQLIESIL